MITRKILLASAAALTLTATPQAPVQAQDAFIGQMLMFGGNFCPRGFANANGGLLPISGNDALFSLIGTIYGGDGRTTFGLPDMRGRTPIGWGQGPGLADYRIGQTGGVENVTLTTAQMPQHDHTAIADAYLRTSSRAADTNSPNTNSLATYANGAKAYKSGTGDQQGMTVTGTVQILPTGGGQSHYNVQPYLPMTWCIATVGVYPSRN